MPRFSLVTPVYNPPINALRDCIDSVRNQHFQDWEWCITDDCSPNPGVRRELEKAAARDPRIRLHFRETNGGIVAASQDSLDLATGEFIGLLDHDDMLHPEALQRVDRRLREEGNENVDYVYTDEDKIDEHGNHYDVFRKPPFDPYRLQGQNYCCHFSVFRAELLDLIGGFRPGFDGSQDYDLILRATEKARKVLHLPTVLYHWRVVPGSAAAEVSAKPYAFISAQKAIEQHLVRTGVKASASSIRPGFTLVRRELTSRPKISIIIPTRGDMKRVWGVTTCIVSNAVNSILTLSTYDNYEVIVMRDVPPTGGEPASWGFVNDPRVRVIDYPFPFNFADKCNVGVLHAEGDVIILLNDDTQVISPDWLESLTALLEDDSVGMVGPMLLLEDGRIQSAGHINDPTPRHLGAGDRGNAPGKFGAYLVTRCVSGVTGACVAMRKKTYMEVGGMSLDYPVSFNDVDLGNKVLESDLKILWTPLARLYHFESLTRDKTVTQEEGLALERRWKRFYNNEVYSR